MCLRAKEKYPAGTKRKEGKGRGESRRACKVSQVFREEFASGFVEQGEGHLLQGIVENKQKIDRSQTHLDFATLLQRPVPHQCRVFVFRCEGDFLLLIW